MSFLNLFRRKKVDPVALAASADAVHAALISLESHLDTIGDRRAAVLVRKLHNALAAAWEAHAPAVGAGPVAFSGGTPKELPQ